MGNLMKELAAERKNIKTDSYDMSIGEIISLYHDNDLKLNPAFQRLYRWDQDHKVRFIESILIGIPIPEILLRKRKMENGISLMVCSVFLRFYNWLELYLTMNP